MHTTVDEVISGRRGVCQDFSHLLIALGRNAGLPMRYASGYLGQSGESEASHAWVEAYIPPWGWIGVDPAGGSVCTGRHVKVAVGRDYADVSVMRGTYRGGVAADLSVSVRCEELGDGRGVEALAGETRRHPGMIQFQTLGGLRSRQLSALSLAFERQARDVALTGMQASWSDAAGPRGIDDAPRQQPQQQQQGPKQLHARQRRAVKASRHD
ncbi:MAG: transglutaminase-like domain-containing protein [Thermomicrobiales bacterium]